MEDAIARLFKLDKDEGYAIQVVVWRNGEDHWHRDHMIQSDDFDEEKAKATTHRLTSFLDQYKKVSLLEATSSAESSWK